MSARIAPPVRPDSTRRRGPRWVAAAAVGVLVLVTGWLFRPVTPNLGEATGDPEVVAAIRESGVPGHRLAVVVIDGGTTRQAFVDATQGTRFEVGSLSKAMAGQLLAEGISRGEISLDDRLGQHLDVGDGPVSQVSMQALATHHSGLPRVSGGVANMARAVWAQFSATDPYAGGLPELEAEAKTATLDGTGFQYSNVGAALAGHATASAAGLDYPELARQRLFHPLGMTDSAVQNGVPLVEPGLDLAGRSQQPWSTPGIAPAGGIVSTAEDLTRYSRAILAGTAPGMSALTPLAAAGDGDRIGLFWITSPYPGGEGSYSWHNGATGGYSSYLAVDRAQGRAVIVLSDVDTGATPLGVGLMTGERVWSGDPGRSGHRATEASTGGADG